jgi:hypothetical protein
VAFGIDRLMFSVGYPFSPNTHGRSFLDGLNELLKPSDLAKLTHRNADELLQRNFPAAQISRG